MKGHSFIWLARKVGFCPPFIQSIVRIKETERVREEGSLASMLSVTTSCHMSLSFLVYSMAYVRMIWGTFGRNLGKRPSLLAKVLAK